MSATDGGGGSGDHGSAVSSPNTKRCPAATESRPRSTAPSTSSGASLEMTNANGPPRVCHAPGRVGSSSGVVRPNSGRIASSTARSVVSFESVDDAVQRRTGVLADVVAAVVGMQRHEVGQRRAALCGVESGGDDHRVLDVAALDIGGATGTDRPEAARLAEDAREERGGVEAREAGPVDRSAPAHERGCPGSCRAGRSHRSSGRPMGRRRGSSSPQYVGGRERRRLPDWRRGCGRRFPGGRGRAHSGAVLRRRPRCHGRGSHGRADRIGRMGDTVVGVAPTARC